jgi:hypothetical protein
LRRVVVAAPFVLVIATVGSCFDWAALSPDAGSALQLQGGCAALGLPTGSAISMTGTAFTVSFWMSVDTAASGPIVWQGGTMLGEAGWSFSIDASEPKIVFCVGNQDLNPQCVQAPFMLHHAIHIAMTTAPGTVNFTRSVNLYTLDWTAGQTAHTLADTNDTAINTWVTTSVFTLGGADVDGGCTRTSPVTLGAVRVWPSALGAPALDANFNQDISCAGLAADFRLDEGAGSVATDCSNSEPALTLVEPFAWVPSPFP